jgi:NhaA family Na+:H+ antiporter
MSALHPALALCFVVPFLPGPKADTGLFSEEDDASAGTGTTHGAHHSPLHNFEHSVKLSVDMGLFFFGFANAGVAFAEVGTVTWMVLAALVVGKTIGITAFSMAGTLIGFPLPTGMRPKHLIVAGTVAGLGLTVALFVAGQAFPPGSPYQGPAKMGAIFSASVALLAFALGRILKVKDGGPP